MVARPAIVGERECSSRSSRSSETFSVFFVVTKQDPVFLATRYHFEDLLQRYGSPLLVLNLVKQAERTPRETLIGTIFTEAVSFINKFLPEVCFESYLRFVYSIVSE